MENKNTTNIFWGVVLIILGFAFLADQFTVFNFGKVIGVAWPLILTGLGVYMLTKHPKSRGAYVLIFLGLIFFIGSVTSFNIWTLWPLVLVFIGVSSLLGWQRNESTFNAGSTVTNEDKIDDTVVFWGLDKKITSQSFQGGEVSAIFGGITLDLTGAKLAPNARIEVNAVFGGVEVRVPSTINVSSNGTGIFGGFSNRVSHKADATETLSITGSAVFGGVDVK